jgi:hypothetical protein
MEAVAGAFNGDGSMALFDDSNRLRQGDATREMVFDSGGGRQQGRLTAVFDGGT